MSNQRKHIGIAEWTDEHDGPVRLIVTLELRTGDLAGDLAPRGFQTVEHEPCPAGVLTLSATHELMSRRSRRRDPMISAGAGMVDVPDRAMWCDGWSRDAYETLRGVADRWHLNTMRAACAHVEPVYETDKYGQRRPSLDLTPACPVSGYKYGHAWLVEPMPADVLAYVTGLLGGEE